MLTDKFQNYLEKWEMCFFGEIDDLGKYIEEENLLMSKSVIGRCRDSLKELDNKFTDYMRIVIKGDKNE